MPTHSYWKTAVQNTTIYQPLKQETRSKLRAQSMTLCACNIQIPDAHQAHTTPILCQDCNLLTCQHSKEGNNCTSCGLELQKETGHPNICTTCQALWLLSKNNATSRYEKDKILLSESKDDPISTKAKLSVANNNQPRQGPHHHTQEHQKNLQ